jgi:hypothetical protein
VVKLDRRDSNICFAQSRRVKVVERLDFGSIIGDVQKSNVSGVVVGRFVLNGGNASTSSRKAEANLPLPKKKAGQPQHANIHISTATSQPLKPTK